MQEQWTAVDDYLTDLLAPADPALTSALADGAAAGLPAFEVTPVQGKLLHLLARIQGARSILEIGALGGYSTIWLARALPKGGRLVTLEIDPRHAAVARVNLTRAGLSEIVEIRVGRALDSLAQLLTEGAGPFDFIFIDADKPSNTEYLAAALKLARPGAVIIVDNVVRDGQVVDADNQNPNVQGARRFLEALAVEPRLEATAVQTVGAKGYDGFVLARVTGGE